jgi:hypothetical protein
MCKNDATRAARALEVSWVVSLVAALALWASPVMAGPPPGSTAVTVNMCVHTPTPGLGGIYVHSFNSNDTAIAVSFETSPLVVADIHTGFSGARENFLHG